ncbi:MAG: two component signal transduction system twitching motility response regualator PilG [Phormidesmis priestleyi Ana]|uniref:Two component signal transduction system twitching motility response regualator PilG n=1 Tax=Phormidesmis priestleyi Ana TaxID=1666911 RepID=A0A0P8C473_9CYAN|nr:MAG: two component signal transduction system twitching motility response regualator PilG [Phormidesmis priestleyi Ana]
MINSRSSTSYSTSHKLHPLSLLAQLISRQVSGCLKLTAQASEWRLLFNRGQLNFATNSTGAFDRLDRHLQSLTPGQGSAPAVPRDQIDQVRLLFEQSDEVDEVVSRDYRALCWLVEQQAITTEQAGQLISAIAIEVIEPFLNIREGSYELIPASRTAGIPTFCDLDLRPIVEVCQRNSKQRANGTPVTSRLPDSVTATSTLQTQMGGGPRTQMNGRGMAGLQSGIGQDALKQTSYTVACIDDSPTVLNAIQKFLEDQSLSVVAINDPVKALMQIVRSKPDLILLDITMPNLDGYELCALLRRHPRYKRTPIVMVTGNTGLIDRARAKLVRASGYLTKPFTQTDLLKMVFKHLPSQKRP